MSIDIEAIFKVVAFGVPALLVLGGIILLLVGYPVNSTDIINGGWALIILGAGIYIVELLAQYLS